ncbi:hypothetical protein F5I97DRAFT_15030 [Phlebopus sp. FC_14]|nr:hypothetical protein F5I97DRAFT_15030 [Phlebopus sp. FC_14]
MSSTPTTFATLRALHALVGEALDDIQRVFSQSQLISTPSPPSSLCSSPAYPGTPEPVSSFPTTPSASFPPTPLSSMFPYETNPSSLPYSAAAHIVDYPSPDNPFIPTSTAEQLAAHPDAAAAAMRIVAACGQISNIVHKPFLSLCDGLMSYNLPACLRLIEHLHVVEILRETEEERQRLIARSKKALPQIPGQSPLSDDEAPPLSSEPGDRQLLPVYEHVKSGILSSLEQGNKSASCMKQDLGKREETAR